MTYQQKLFDYLSQIDLLLLFIPQIKTEKQMDMINEEIGNLRRSIFRIEEMSRTEKQRKCKLKIMTIESELNNF